MLIACYALALVFWLFHQLNAEHNAMIRLPIRIVHERENILPIVSPPEQLNVNVSGYGWSLLGKSILLKNTPLYIDLEDPLKQRHIATKAIMPLVSETLRDVKVNYILEDSIYFYYDTIISRKVLVKIDSSKIQLAEDYRKTSPYFIEPDTVEITGASSLVKKFPDFLVVKPVLQNVDSDVDMFLSVGVEDSKLITFLPKDVKLRFTVKPYAKKEIPVKLIYQNFPRNSPLKIKNASSLKMTCWSFQKDSLLSVDSIMLWIDYKQIRWKDTTVAPSYQLPSFCQEVKPSLSVLKLIINEQ